MIEVFLIALLALIVKNMPGNSLIEFHIGIWLFTASVFLSLVAAQMDSTTRSSAR